MTHVVVGSLNPIKCSAVSRAFKTYSLQFPEEIADPLTFSNMMAETPILDQPRTNYETMRGAIYRARYSADKMRADYGVGLEGGIFPVGANWFCNSWVAIAQPHHDTVWIGQGPGVMIPSGIMSYITHDGLELGDAEDRYFSLMDIKRGIGLTGIMSREMITREDSFSLATLCALGSMKFIL